MLMKLLCMYEKRGIKESAHANTQHSPPVMQSQGKKFNNFLKNS